MFKSFLHGMLLALSCMLLNQSVMASEINVRACKYDAGLIRRAVIYKNAGIDMQTQLAQTNNPVLRSYLPIIYRTDNANPTTFFREYFFKCRGD